MAKYAVFCGLRSVGSCLDNLSGRSGDLKIGITWRLYKDVFAV